MTEKNWDSIDTELMGSFDQVPKTESQIAVDSALTQY